MENMKEKVKSMMRGYDFFLGGAVGAGLTLLIVLAYKAWGG